MIPNLLRRRKSSCALPSDSSFVSKPHVEQPNEQSNYDQNQSRRYEGENSVGSLFASGNISRDPKPYFDLTPVGIPLIPN